MKGTLSLQRLKRAAAVAGAGALVVGGTLLGSTQAHAAVTQFGSGTGLTFSPATGTAASTTPTYQSAACPAGFQGSAVLLAIDPTTPAGTTEQNTNAAQVAPPNLAVNVAFSGTWSQTIGSLDTAALGMNISPGVQFEVADYCYTAANATGPGEYGPSTFITINADGSYTANQTVSAAPQSVNLSLAANPNPATSGQTVTLTATASVAAATGTVSFENNGTVIGSPVALSGGTAATAFSAPTVTAASTVNLTAVYTPSGSFTAGTGGSLALPVNPAPPNSGTIPLAVDVPATGSFILTVDSTDTVSLAVSGSTATGAATAVTVADTRNTYPGWSVSGQDGSWTGSGGTFSGNQLGWTPTDTALAPGVTLGSPVAAGSPGLGSAAALASVAAGTGNGFGTTTLGANLTLALPANVAAGSYSSGLTISAVTSNP
jgi:hypothetical protein